MHWTLLNSTTLFAIANGNSPADRVEASADMVLTQETPTALLVRGAWPTAYPTRAARSAPITIPVTLPPCADVDAALLQQHTLPASCPAGGELVGHDGTGEGVSYAQAWVEQIATERQGLTNRLTYQLRATNPSAVSYYTDLDGEIFTDIDGTPFF